jgi:dihydrofolate reductase
VTSILITVDGPELAAQAIRAGLVDEFQMIVCPVVVGGGKRFFPDVVASLPDGVRGGGEFG